MAVRGSVAETKSLQELVSVECNFRVQRRAAHRHLHTARVPEGNPQKFHVRRRLQQFFVGDQNNLHQQQLRRQEFLEGNQRVPYRLLHRHLRAENRKFLDRRRRILG